MSFHKPRPGESDQIVINRNGPTGGHLEERGHPLRILNEVNDDNGSDDRQSDDRWHWRICFNIKRHPTIYPVSLHTRTQHRDQRE